MAIIYSFVRETGKDGSQDSRAPRNSLALTSLSWENLKGALLVSLRTIWTFLKGTIRLYRKVVGHIFNASKAMMSWDKLCSYFSFVQRSVYSTCPWFLFHKNFKSYHVYSVVHQVAFLITKLQLVFITSYRSSRCRVPMGDLLILVQNHQKSAKKKAR